MKSYLVNLTNMVYKVFANKWIEPYLYNRKQYVSINVFKSSNTSVLTYGVLQGSELGPLLFLIYTKPS